MDASLVIQLAEDAMAVKLVAAACMTALIYDHAITFDEEVERVWPSRISIPKLLFFLNRYVVGGMLIFNAIASSQAGLSPSVCVFFLRWLAVTVTAQNAIVQGILVMRVWALHRQNKVALSIALSFYFGGVITLIGLTVQDYVGEAVAIDDDLSQLPGCYATTVPSIIGGFWIAPLVIESVLFLLVVSRAFKWWRDGSSAPRILSLLARDSTLYFAIVFALLLANFIMFQLGPPFLASLLVTPSNTAGVILGSHLLLNLRALAAPPPGAQTLYSNPPPTTPGCGTPGLGPWRLPPPPLSPGGRSISVKVETISKIDFKNEEESSWASDRESGWSDSLREVTVVDSLDYGRAQAV
ncbi:hypothetical protein BDN72DRAFT_959739 [Pluteus cervinus]|uniref:Uncharacterized protein n=1 Tax=Pluteus cervinus TaxID=181527 RepID=A0ACD3AUD0_9AGAR|nr:hypothetical protein BDN72DRAFT_959739 [Pluteus cervinus]